MKEKNISIQQQLEAFDQGIILDSDGQQSSCFNFYDWFCNDSSLKNRAMKLFPKVKKFLQLHPEIDVKKTYVFFKNNCPFVGNSYDDFRICERSTGNVIYTVTPSCGHRATQGQCEIWGRENKFDRPLLTAPNWKEALTRMKETAEV